MGNVLVIYDSRTGNTKKMAELVAEGAKRIEGTQVNTDQHGYSLMEAEEIL